MEGAESARNGNADAVLSQHETNLASLRSDYGALVALRERSAELLKDRLAAEYSVEAIAERMLGEGNESELCDELCKLDARLVSLRAREAFNAKKERISEEGLQSRLPADIAATERLAGHWLWHLEMRETRVLLQTVAEGEAAKAEVQQAARCLAINGRTYLRMVAELGDPAGVSYAWTRELEPLPSSKSLASQQLLAHDALFAPPKREDTVAALLGAAERAIARWSALLAQVSSGVTAGTFVMPSYVEQPKAASVVASEWNQDLDVRPWHEKYLASIGKTWDQLSPSEKQILMDAEAGNETWKKEPLTVAAEIVTEA